MVNGKVDGEQTYAGRRRHFPYSHRRRAGSGEYLSIINVSSWLQIVPRWFLCHIIAILLSYGFANKWFPNMNPNYESVIWQNIHTLSLRVWLPPFDDILQHFWSNLTKILFLTIYCFISCVSTWFLRDTAMIKIDIQSVRPSLWFYPIEFCKPSSCHYFMNKIGWNIFVSNMMKCIFKSFTGGWEGEATFLESKVKLF